jgi:AcrR family transcriptional regulator
LPSGQTRRPRRSTQEVRDRILRSARELFASEGYAGATTREIAQRADVTEALLFRAFTSKEKLFEAAVVEPFNAFLEGYTERWLQAPIPGGTPEEVLRQFVEELHDLAREHRELFAAMAYSTLGIAGTQPAFDRLAHMGEIIGRTHGLQFDAPVAVRIATTTVVAVSMLEDTLFPAGSGITRERIADEMLRMLIGAARYSPPPGS